MYNGGKENCITQSLVTFNNQTVIREYFNEEDEL
jgi:hypothetical protein